MSAAKWGLLSGIAGGVGQGFQMSLQARLDEAKEKRLREWTSAQMKEQRQYAQEEKLSDRTYQEEQQTKQLEREDSRRAVNEEVTREGNKQISVQKNAQGEVVGRKEAFLTPDKSKGFGMSKGILYNRDTGEYEVIGGDGTGKPITMTDREKAQVKSLDSDIAALRKNAADDPAVSEQIFQKEQQRNQLLGLEAQEGGISPQKDDALRTEAMTLAEKWVEEQAGTFSSDETDFKDYGGNRQEAVIQKANEIYQQLRGTPVKKEGLLQPKTEAKKEQPKPRSEEQMADMPDPSQHTGRMIRDEETGKMYKSDGKNWKPL